MWKEERNAQWNSTWNRMLTSRESGGLLLQSRAYWRMNRWVTVSFLLKPFCGESVVKARVNSPFTGCDRPETEWAIHVQGEPRLTSWGRPEPVVVSITWDEMWLEVICLTNSEIAGSPRNISRYSLKFTCRGRALDGFWSSNRSGSTKLRILQQLFQSQSDPAKRSGLKGNNPDQQLRSLNTS